MNSSRQIKCGALLGYVSITINILAGLIYTPWMVSILGQSDYGLYTLAVSLISLFMFDFGMSAAVARFLSREHAAGREQRVGQLLGCLYKIFFAIDVLILIVLLCIGSSLDAIYVGLTPYELEKLRVVFAIVGVYNLMVFPAIPFSGILTSYEKFVPLKLCDIFNKLFSISCIVLSLLMGGGLYALVFFTSLSGLLTTGIKYIVVRKGAKVKADLSYWSKESFKELFCFSAWTTIINVAQRLIFNLTPSVLGVVSNTSAVAVFGIASTIEGYVYTIANAMNGLFVTRVARISVDSSENSREQHLDLMIKIGRIQFIIVGLIFSVFLSLGGEFVRLWLGLDYENSYIAATLLLIPMLFSSSQQIAETVVSIENKVKQQSGVFVVMALLNLALTIPLSSRYGAVGAAASICIAYLIRTILMNVLYYKELDLDVFTFYKACYTSLWVPILVAIATGLLISPMLLEFGWLAFLFKAFVEMVVYCAFLWFFLTPFERHQIVISLKIFRIRNS